jgi:hypothetical protein
VRGFLGFGRGQIISERLAGASVTRSATTLDAEGDTL